MEPCNHKWIYERMSCCYLLRCTECMKSTRAYRLDGDNLKPGDPVKLNGETISVIKK